MIPDFRRNEMLNRIRGGLKDICISRTSTDWGISLPWDERACAVCLGRRAC